VIRRSTSHSALAGLAALALATSAGAQKQDSCLAHRDDPLTIVVTADGTVLVGGKETALEDLVPKIQAVIAQLGVDSHHGVHVCPETTASYESVARVLKVLQVSGLVKIGVIQSG
jgi:biopolymer transport protein ExbD